MYYKQLKEDYEKHEAQSFILQDRLFAYKKHLFDSNNPAKLQNRTSTEILFELQKFDKFLLIAYPSLEAISEIEVSHIENYKRFCVEGLGNTYPTTNKKLRAIRKFFDFLRDINHIIKHNVALEVSYFYEDIENQPVHIPGSRLKLLMDIMYNYKYGVRDVCITKLIALMGLRIGDIFELSYKSVNLQAKELYVKRDADTITFPIPDLLYVDLKEYIGVRVEIVNSTKNYENNLFLSSTGNEYPLRSYQKRFKAAVIEADFKEIYTPRNVRATFAYYMAKNIGEDRLKMIMDQDKVDQYYMKEVTLYPSIH